MNISPLKIGNIIINTPVLLAPMEDVTSLPFRLICKEIANPGLMFTEFVSAMAIHYNAKKTYKKLQVHPTERPLAVQIFGSNPEIMAETAKIVEEHGADIIDINMGCWVPKVCRTGSGAALLKDPNLATEIVKSVVDAVKIPVTVKVRAGWDYSLFAAPELAKRFEDVGAKMITLHARFAKQGFEGKADWDLIQNLVKTVSIPVIGNGDIKTATDAENMVRQTGCAGVMIGRGAISNPWALSKICAAFRNEEEPEDPNLEERIATALRHLKLTIEYEQNADPTESYEIIEGRATRSLRGQLPLYIKNYPGASKIRGRITACNTYKEVEDILMEYSLASKDAFLV